MVKKLLSRSEFAATAKVSPAAVTKACRGVLNRAREGKFIDVNHPDAAAYVAQHAKPLPSSAPDIAPGVDTFYEAAVVYARELGRISINSLQQKFGIGFERARKLVAVINATDAVNLPVKSTKPTKRAIVKAVKANLHVESVFEELAKMAAPPANPQDEEDEQLPSPSAYPDVEELVDMTLRELINKFGTAERFKVWLQARKSLVDIGAKEIANAEKRGKLIPRDFVEAHIIGNFNRVHINLMTDAAQTIARRLVGDIKAGASVEDCETFVSEQISRHVREAKATVERVLANVGV